MELPTSAELQQRVSTDRLYIEMIYWLKPVVLELAGRLPEVIEYLLEQSAGIVNIFRAQSIFLRKIIYSELAEQVAQNLPEEYRSPLIPDLKATRILLVMFLEELEDDIMFYESAIKNNPLVEFDFLKDTSFGFSQELIQAVSKGCKIGDLLSIQPAALAWTLNPWNNNITSAA